MKCHILALDHCPLSSVTGPMEILSLANSLVPKKHGFDIRILSEHRSGLTAMGGLNLQTHGALDDTNDYKEVADLVIVGAIGHPARRKQPTSVTTLNWLKYQYEHGAQVVSICTGAFVLAESGLLDGQPATTHWACQSLFKQRFPKVQLNADAMITQGDRLACSGGASAFQDMSIFLIRQYLGASIARQCAKSVLVDLDRHSQLQYSDSNVKAKHSDALIQQVQNWLSDHAQSQFTLADLAAKVNLSERQFKRRFTQACGQSPLAYIQAVRMDMAKQLLESSMQKIESISLQSGYEDVRFFRRLFKRSTGLSPSEYRSKFSY